MNKFINYYIGLIVVLYLICLVLVIKAGGNWKVFLLFGTPLIALRLVRSILLIKTQ